MRKGTLIVIGLAIAALLVVPRIMAAMRPKMKGPEQPPAQQQAPAQQKKKTVLGKLIGGVTELATALPGPYGQKVAAAGGAIGQFTK